MMFGTMIYAKVQVLHSIITSIINDGNSMIYQFFATCPKGLELLLVDELRHLGAESAREKLAGVEFTASLETAYKACLWSRLANRILLRLEQFPAASPEELYAGTQKINWLQHFNVDNTFAIHCTCSQSEINHSLFAAQKIKDAIVDQFRDKTQTRPNVEKEEPNVSIYCHISKNIATLYLDMSGKSLHRRGYRLDTGAAPLKENLAAAILIRANWITIARAQGALMDPMCGSGTLLIEAALMAGDIAPGLQRDYFGFIGWKQHQPAVWEKLRNEAKDRREKGMANLPPIIGYDQDSEAIKIAFANIERAGMLGKIHVEKRELESFTAKANVTAGLVVTNPPYGERLGEIDALQPLYTELGTKLKENFVGWNAAVFTGNPDLGKQMGLRAKQHYALFNGSIPCKLLLFSVEPSYFVDRSEGAENVRRIRAAQKATIGPISEALQMFINRLIKNFKHLAPQMERQGQTSYRLYDADLPEYAFAIDVKEGSIYVQEYEAPREINEKKVIRRRNEVLACLPEILQVDPQKIFFTIVAR